MGFNTASTTYYGLDVPVNHLRDLFTSKLFSGKTYSSYGQAYNLNDDGVPYVYNETNDKYEEVLFDDRKDAISFFFQNGEATKIDGHYFEAPVEILFALKLDQIEDDVSLRDLEEVTADIYNVVKYNSMVQITGRVLGIDAFSSFNTEKIITKDMLPSVLIKFNTIVKFKLQ